MTFIELCAREATRARYDNGCPPPWRGSPVVTSNLSTGPLCHYPHEVASAGRLVRHLHLDFERVRGTGQIDSLTATPATTGFMDSRAKRFLYPRRRWRAAEDSAAYEFDSPYFLRWDEPRYEVHRRPVHYKHARRRRSLRHTHVNTHQQSERAAHALRRDTFICPASRLTRSSVDWSGNDQH